MAKALDRIATASRTSPLKRWMQRNRDAFAASLAEADPPDWQAIARILEAEGLTLSGGRPLTRDAVRMTWQRIAKPVEGAAVPLAGLAGAPEADPLPGPTSAEPEPAPEPPPSPAPQAPSAGLSWLEKLRKKKD